MNPSRAGIDRLRFFWLAGAVTAIAGSGCARKLLISEDVVFPKNQPAELAAAVDRQTAVIFTKGVGATPVEFFVDDQKVAQAETDKEGRAVGQGVVVEGRQNFKSRAHLYGKWVESEGRLYSWDPAKPAIAVDIDETLSLSQYINIIWGDGLVSKPLPGSPEGVRQLAKEYQIIYWSIRPRFMYERTRKWLEKYGFPDGPMLFTDSFHAAFHQTERKRVMLKELREKWPNVRIAVGDKLADVVSCHDTGILPVIVNPLVPKFKQHAIVVRDWNTLISRSGEFQEYLSQASPNGDPSGRRQPKQELADVMPVGGSTNGSSH